VLVAPDRKAGAADSAVSPHAPDTEAARQMRERLASELGKGLYWMRKAIIELVFGRSQRYAIFADSGCAA